MRAVNGYGECVRLGGVMKINSEDRRLEQSEQEKSSRRCLLFKILLFTQEVMGNPWRELSKGE